MDRRATRAHGLGSAAPARTTRSTPGGDRLARRCSGGVGHILAREQHPPQPGRAGRQPGEDRDIFLRANASEPAVRIAAAHVMCVDQLAVGVAQERRSTGVRGAGGVVPRCMPVLPGMKRGVVGGLCGWGR